MRHGLGSEHPLCDRIQLIMLILFFAVWSVDSLGFFMFGYSTVIFEALAFPVLFAGTLVSLCLSFYLISKSHKAVLEQVNDPPKLVDSGVYAWVRHPMYLGTLLFCLAFLFISVSLVSIVIWLAFFIFFDRMATYEGKKSDRDIRRTIHCLPTTGLQMVSRSMVNFDNSILVLSNE